MKNTHKKQQKAAKADNVRTYTKAERAEILTDAKAACKVAGVRPTPATLRRVVTDEMGEATAAAVFGDKSAPKAKPAKAVPKAATKKVVRLVFGFPVSAVARALGKAGMKPADAVEAIHKHQPDASPLAVKTFVFAGRHGLRGKPAPLTKTQLKILLAA